MSLISRVEENGCNVMQLARPVGEIILKLQAAICMNQDAGCMHDTGTRGIKLILKCRRSLCSLNLLDGAAAMAFIPKCPHYQACNLVILS